MEIIHLENTEKNIIENSEHNLSGMCDIIKHNICSSRALKVEQGEIGEENV